MEMRAPAHEDQSGLLRPHRAPLLTTDVGTSYQICGNDCGCFSPLHEKGKGNKSTIHYSNSKNQKNTLCQIFVHRRRGTPLSPRDFFSPPHLRVPRTILPLSNERFPYRLTYCFLVFHEEYLPRLSAPRGPPYLLPPISGTTSTSSVLPPMSSKTSSPISGSPSNIGYDLLPPISGTTGTGYDLRYRVRHGDLRYTPHGPHSSSLQSPSSLPTNKFPHLLRRLLDYETSSSKETSSSTFFRLLALTDRYLERENTTQGVRRLLHARDSRSKICVVFHLLCDFT